MQRGCRLGQWERGRACPSANSQAVGVVPPVSSNGPARRGWAPPPSSTNQMGRAGPAAPNRRLRSGIQTDRWKRGRWRRSGPDGTGNGGGARPGPAVSVRPSFPPRHHVNQQLHLRGPVRGRAVLPLLPAGAELAGDEGRAAGGHRDRPLLHRHPALGVSAGTPRGRGGRLVPLRGSLRRDTAGPGAAACQPRACPAGSGLGWGPQGRTVLSGRPGASKIPLQTWCHQEKGPEGHDSTRSCLCSSFGPGEAKAGQREQGRPSSSKWKV